MGYAPSSDNLHNQGGGGGAAGRIRINSTTLDNNGLLSPDPSTVATTFGPLPSP